MQRAIRVAMLDAGGYKRNDRLVQVSRVVANGTRLWIYCALGGATEIDAGVDPNQAFNANSLEGMAIKSNKEFQAVLGRPVAGPQIRPDRHTQRLRAATRDDRS